MILWEQLVISACFHGVRSRNALVGEEKDLGEWIIVALLALLELKRRARESVALGSYLQHGCH
jgi:hypothetical protein